MHSFYIHGARERRRKEERRLECSTGHYVGRDYVSPFLKVGESGLKAVWQRG